MPQILEIPLGQNGHRRRVHIETTNDIKKAVLTASRSSCPGGMKARFCGIDALLAGANSLLMSSHRSRLIPTEGGIAQTNRVDAHELLPFRKLDTLRGSIPAAEGDCSPRGLSTAFPRICRNREIPGPGMVSALVATPSQVCFGGFEEERRGGSPGTSKTDHIECNINNKIDKIR